MSARIRILYCRRVVAVVRGATANVKGQVHRLRAACLSFECALRTHTHTTHAHTRPHITRLVSDAACTHTYTNNYTYTHTHSKHTHRPRFIPFQRLTVLLFGIHFSAADAEGEIWKSKLANCNCAPLRLRTARAGSSGRWMLRDRCFGEATRAVEC